MRRQPHVRPSLVVRGGRRRALSQREEEHYNFLCLRVAWKGQRFAFQRGSPQLEREAHRVVIDHEEAVVALDEVGQHEKGVNRERMRRKLGIRHA